MNPQAVAERVPGVLLILGLLALWEASVRLGWVLSPTWPAVSAVLATFWTNHPQGT